MTNAKSESISSSGGLQIKKHLIATQIPIHARYGGVVPEVAARTHVAEIVSLLDKILRPDSKSGWDGGCFDAIAVTQGPGLATALRVGIETAKALAWAYGKPLVPVNHLEGHLASAWLVPGNRKLWRFPILFLLVSGGHTELVLMEDFCQYRVLGRTRDDAAGEAFDKTAKLLGLPYPGGPHLSKLAATGNPQAFNLPRPMLHDPSLDFSFSGLKTAVRVLVSDQWSVDSGQQWGRKRTGHLPLATGHSLEDLCASIQAAIVETLVAKTIQAAKLVQPRAVAVVGGVSANPLLKSALRYALKRECPGVVLLAPAKGLYTDNGAMIAAAGFWNLFKEKKLPRWQAVDAEPDLDL